MSIFIIKKQDEEFLQYAIRIQKESMYGWGNPYGQEYLTCEQVEEILEWCKSSFVGKWKINVGYRDQRNEWCWIHIEKDEDLVLFKLRWM